MITISNANDGSTKVVDFSFTDEDAAAIIPTSVTWSLYDGCGGIVNSRLDVAVTPASSLSIVLSGDDLSAGDGSPAAITRLILIEAVYNTVIDGITYTSLPITEQAKFSIEDFVGV